MVSEGVPVGECAHRTLQRDNRKEMSPREGLWGCKGDVRDWQVEEDVVAVHVACIEQTSKREGGEGRVSVRVSRTL